MAQLISSLESIRQTLNNGQFDACETLLRDMLENPEVNDDARPFLKEVLASVVTRRALDHARNFVARGNMDAARRIMHRVWHQLESEGLDDVSSHARSAIARAAGESEESGFDADSLSAIISEYLGLAHFEGMIEGLPEAPDDRATQIIDRATRVVKSAEIKPIQTQKTSVVVHPSTTSVGQAILRSMMRPRVILIAALVFIGVFAAGWVNRTTTYRTEFTLLRPTSTGDERYSAKVHALPKQTLQGLPTQGEVVNSVSERLDSELSDDLLRDAIKARNLKGMISASVASGDYGATDSALRVIFEAPSEEIASSGGKHLMNRIIEYHNMVVTSDIRQSVDLKKKQQARNQERLDALNAELQKLLEGTDVPIGDNRQMRETLSKMLEESQKGYNIAAAKVAASEVRAKAISESMEELPQTIEWITSQPETAALLLQPLYLQLNADKQRAEKLRAEVSAGQYGGKHPVFIELKGLDASITAQTEYLKSIDNSVSESMRESKTIRNNSTRDSMDFEARMALAQHQANMAELRSWRDSLSRVRDALKNLDSGEESLGAKASELVNIVETQEMLRREIADLEVFAERSPGGLIKMSDLSAPELSVSSPVKILLAAIGLAFLAAIIVSFTGGQRAVHMVVLGLIATLFQVR
ncbi:MAG: hypothetical protein KDB07_08580 [Planctomycetes bacterium]|nr:hypothetical protein [Planctomycetota bacterium]